MDVDTVFNSALDFRSTKALSAALEELPNGLDNNFVVAPCSKNDLSSASEPGGMLGSSRVVATLFCPESGRGFELSSNAPGLQIYTGGFLEGSPGKGVQVVHQRFQGICLETQAFPDAVNHPSFPSPLIEPGKIYRHQMCFRFFNK